ncbi:MAG TPA: signal recognition particle-docking protein FtsY [Acidobacteriota bacterium]|nr:signal recognition particle-docking protein FtsY [Acidobacteriota bacterium]
MAFWSRKKDKGEGSSSLSRGLEKTRKGIFGRIGDLLRGARKLDDDLLEELEEILIGSDVGVGTSMEIVGELREKALDEKQFDPEAIRQMIQTHIAGILDEASAQAEVTQGKPHVILVVGVNGTGKTTSIGKLAHRHSREGKKVILAAADTFRAAAIEQLQIWADRSGAEIIKHKSQADPAAVVFDALAAAKSRVADMVIIDTAGRLHTKHNLMNELDKIRRIIEREIEGAPHEVLLVLDATTGQNGLVQAEEFMKFSGLTGIVLAKLDGTAKGGVVIAITKKMNLPIRYVGVGEQIEDLVDFDPEDFAASLFEE